ncbi:DNA-binding NarL/FixJ family response regulator [Lewinella marina]|uniref:DNA-binding response regulator n=1 Tax=Neolewinella marina TaxID=438751 RepID=A0A2G0CC81_9BACT|nr:response regulator transcription factor [Neolewinella marina]NJB86779.1 DNA-binding NarL/FixJ family response regulator [Neolewinella marina]PHK97584.1 DNA-binding response regulator [Neolewinella marina]
MTLEALRILVVEDDPVIRTDLKSLLLSRGLAVVGTAKNALQAYDQLRSARPNFVILDINLGTGPSGLEVAEVVHTTYHLPYIFLTSYSDAATLEAAMQQNPYGYLVKPFQDETVLSTLAVAWGNHQRLRQNRGIDLSDCPEPLTDQEERIARLLVEGLSYRSICERLFISQNTLKYHVKHIYAKFGVAGRAALVATVYR